MTKFRAEWEDGYTAIWRNLTWAEFKNFYPLWLNRIFTRPMDLYLEIYRTCILSGPVPDVVPAGIVTYIAEQQLINNPFSGNFKDVNFAVQFARQKVSSNYLLSAQAIIAGVFKYKLEEIEDFDPPTFFVRLAQAEILLGPILQPGDPNQSKETKGKLSKEKIVERRPLDRTVKPEVETHAWTR